MFFSTDTIQERLNTHKRPLAHSRPANLHNWCATRSSLCRCDARKTTANYVDEIAVADVRENYSYTGGRIVCDALFDTMGERETNKPIEQTQRNECAQRKCNPPS